MNNLRRNRFFYLSIFYIFFGITYSLVFGFFKAELDQLISDQEVDLETADVPAASIDETGILRVCVLAKSNKLKTSSFQEFELSIDLGNLAVNFDSPGVARSSTYYISSDQIRPKCIERTIGTAVNTQKIEHLGPDFSFARVRDFGFDQELPTILFESLSSETIPELVFSPKIILIRNADDGIGRDTIVLAPEGVLQKGDKRWRLAIPFAVFLDCLTFPLQVFAFLIYASRAH